MAAVELIDIPRLRRMKGNSRVWIPNSISELILDVDYSDYPGLWLEFLESKPEKGDSGEWIEHKWVLRAIKQEDSKIYYIGELLKTLGKLLTRISLNKTWEEEVDWSGLEEIQTDDPTHYYFLISILSNGKDNYPKEESN